MSDTERLVDNGGPSGGTLDGGPEGDRPATSEREAYFQALRLWIQQAQMYQNISTCFPYYMMTLQGLQNTQTNVPLLNNNYQFQGQQFPFQVPIPPRQPTENQVPGEPLSPAEGILIILLLTTTCFAGCQKIRKKFKNYYSYSPLNSIIFMAYFFLQF